MLQVVLNCSVLTALEHLCKSNHEPIRKEACWTVSNIAAGNKVQIQVSSIVYYNIYHFDTSDQREEPVYKSHIAHLSVRYKK